jgi:hypothetical protein
MSKAKLDGEIRTHDYLTGLGLSPERFGKAEMNAGRTPDFRDMAEDNAGRQLPKTCSTPSTPS